MEPTLSELLAGEHEDHQKIILNYLTQPCRTTAIQNPVIKEPSLIIAHQLGKRCPDSPNCPSFHTYEEKRRKVINENAQTLSYNPIPCPEFVSRFLCEDEDGCTFSHSNSEIVYHPAVYKTRECKLKPCPYEWAPYLCPDLHSREPSRTALAASYEKFKVKQSSNHQSVKGKVLMNLNFFKTTPCNKKGSHDKKTCPYYHNDIDKRRPTTEYNYCFEICSTVNKNYCPCDQSCPFAKNKVEQLYHPEKYKKKFCENFPLSVQKCEYGDFCSFAHNESEIRTELFYKEKQDNNFYMYKFKTVYCPFKNEHDRCTCPYAHNVQDFRRSPLLYKYEPEECPNWNKSESMTSYEQPGCIKMLDCDKCHGWKEYEYHPLVYKTKLCSNGAKCQKKDCAYHHNKDKRVLSKVLSPNSDKQLKVSNGAIQLNNSPKNLFKQDFLMETREKKVASNFQRPMLANFIPQGTKLQLELADMALIQSQNPPQLTQEGSNGNQHRMQSPPNSVTSTLLQESYSTRYNSATSSVKDSSEDESMHENQKHRTPKIEKTRGFSPQSNSSEKTSQKPKTKKPLKITKKNQAFIPTSFKEGFDESTSIYQSRFEQSFPTVGSLDLQPRFQSRSDTPDSIKSASYDKRSMGSEMFQQPVFNVQPRFPSYGSKVASTTSPGIHIFVNFALDDGKGRNADPFQNPFTSQFDLDEPKLVTSKVNSKPSSYPGDNEGMFSSKFMDDIQNDEDDLKVLLNQIDQFAEANNDSFNSDDRVYH